MNTYINIISGFLGAGKTTFLKKVIPNIEGKIALIENEFGDVSVDGDLIEGKLPIKEIYAGCICCSLVGDFKKAIEEIVSEHKPNHIFIEPSGVGSLSDIIKVCKTTIETMDYDIRLNHLVTIVDASCFEEYIENFGGFYLEQIQNAHIIFLSHLDEVDNQEKEKVISKIRLNNRAAIIVEEQWYEKDGKEIISIVDSIKNCEGTVKERNLLTPANKTFSSVSTTKVKQFSEKELNKVLEGLKNKELGFILRAKGIIKLDDERCVNFNFTPHHYSLELLEGQRQTKVAVIGSEINKERILELFEK